MSSCLKRTLAAAVILVLFLALAPSSPAADAEEPSALPQECVALLSTLKAQLKWDQVKALKCRTATEMTMSMADGRTTMTTSMRGDATMAAPDKSTQVYEITFSGRTLRMYDITDGVDKEIGRVEPDGTRMPMQFKKSRGVGGNVMFLTTMLNPRGIRGRQRYYC